MAKERFASRSAGGRARHGRRIGGADPEADLVQLGSVADVLRLLERGANDVIQLEASVARVRALVAVCLAAIRVQEIGGLEERVSMLEKALRGRPTGSHFGIGRISGEHKNTG
jgi:hypothetical protein